MKTSCFNFNAESYQEACGYNCRDVIGNCREVAGDMDVLMYVYVVDTENVLSLFIPGDSDN